MRRLFLKLHSARGTSMLMALFFFLVCLTAGAAMLASSTASAAKSLNHYQEQQAYLSVSSAARLLKNQLGNSSFVVTAVPHDTGKTDDDGNEIWEYQLETATSPARGNLLTDNILSSGAVSSAVSGTYAITAAGAGESADALQVDAKYVMDLDSKQATFTLTDAKTHRYSMRIIFRTTSTVPDALGQFGIYWDAGTIEKGGDGNA